MPIKMYPSHFAGKEENDRQRAQAEQIAAEFKAEFSAMMRKYNIGEIAVRESHSGYDNYADGFDVEFDGVYSEDGKTVCPYFTVQFSTSESADSIKANSRTMQKRIQIFWEESTGSMWPRPGKFTAGEYDRHLEKFAELIVKECLQILDGEDDYGYESRGVRIAAYRMKKHFGIEE